MCRFDNEVCRFRGVFQNSCHWHVYCVQAKNIDDAFSSCNEVLTDEPDNIDALCDRAETYINNEQFEEGNSVTLYSTVVLGITWQFGIEMHCTVLLTIQVALQIFSAFPSILVCPHIHVSLLQTQFLVYLTLITCTKAGLNVIA